jgi:hypothetical protein
VTQLNRAVLQAIEYHLPEARVTNDALAEFRFSIYRAAFFCRIVAL